MRASESRTKFKGMPLAVFALLLLSAAVVLGYGDKPLSFFARESKTPALGMSEAQPVNVLRLQIVKRTGPLTAPGKKPDPIGT